MPTLAAGDTGLVEPRDDDRAVSGTDKAIPPETLERRERLGRELALIWVGVFVVAAVLIAFVAWLVA